MLKHKRVFLPLCLVLVFALLSISVFAVASSNPTPDPDPDAFYITECTTYGDVLEHFYPDEYASLTSDVKAAYDSQYILGKSDDHTFTRTITATDGPDDPYSAWFETSTTGVYSDPTAKAKGPDILVSLVSKAESSSEGEIRAQSFLEATSPCPQMTTLIIVYDNTSKVEKAFYDSDSNTNSLEMDETVEDLESGMEYRVTCTATVTFPAGYVPPVATRGGVHYITVK